MYIVHVRAIELHVYTACVVAVQCITANLGLGTHA